ncbi:SDR family NAD(P)-dependent oxidoreductase [Actinocrispum wychmicini]|uniref:3-oxoacyl-[acyl-carrier protein] reductase n=1 Tax=Actinocrispum wychmicini TaxID=1213861 RepID=A0A4R2JCF9_9PSEU|nr:SDR family NAD(P)-dependent oxidoreductase [Actinocrispum wychmicini]TCO57243.1 3-oxoacyl-[acyl-carrier protein] reductase [Actinocrispum wychmicini]
MVDLTGRIAVVTGGSRGIGAATATALGRHGARVAVVGRDEEAIAQTVATVDDAIGVRADVTSVAGVAALRERVETELGPPDIVVAFAGGNPTRPRPIVDVDLAEWQAAIDGNLTATFLTLKEFLPGMIERGRGSIITMSSTASRQPTVHSPGPYAVAKAGVELLTRKVAQEVGPNGIRVNCVAPAAIRTERNAQMIPADMQVKMAASYPLGRIGEPTDVAALTVFLASDDSSWLTGLTLDVAGGTVMR